MKERAIAHLNIVGFRAAVAALEDRTLQGRPFVIAGGNGGRVLAWDVSSEAIRQNIKPGMALAAAQRLVKDLRVLAPNPAAYQKVNARIEALINRYAPAWQNDGIGNIFLDISGTQGLFGPPIDCTSRVRHEVLDGLGINAAAAAATNKLVSKVASRAIRPVGLIEVPPGDEAVYMARQHIALLPGIGPGLLRTLAVSGFREIGEIASLSEGEAGALFGKEGMQLRNNALGIDNSPVSSSFGQRRIEKRAELSQDILDEDLIRGIITALAEDGGLEMRGTLPAANFPGAEQVPGKSAAGCRKIRLTVIYSDGLELQGLEKTKQLLVTDSEIREAALRVYQKTAQRRIRLRSIRLSLENLSPLSFEPDLFEAENNHKKRRLQEAVDLIQGRFGVGSVTRGIVYAAASKMRNPE